MPEPASIAGVILAGGLSRRMGGGDKALRPLAGRPLLGHVIDRLRPQTASLALNANGDPARFASFGLPVVADTIEGFAGPLAGVLAGMRWAASQAPRLSHIATAAADTPFFPSDLVARLAAASTAPHTIVLAASDDGVHPVFGLWPIALADDLEVALRAGVRKVLDWTDRHPGARVRFDQMTLGGELVDPFFNVNSPDEMETAERLLSGGMP